MPTVSAAFAVSTLVTTLFDLVHVKPGKSLHHWLHEQLFLPWLSPVNASLAYALMVVALNLLIVGEFYRRKLFLRI